MTAVAKNLKRLRKQAGLTQEELAARLHVTRQAVSNWETARTQPDIETLTALAEALGTDAGELICGPRPKAEGYPRYQKKYAVCTAVCAVLLLAWALTEVWGLPYMKQAAKRGGPLLWYYVLIIRPLFLFTAGVLLPSLASLRMDIRLGWARLRRGLTALGLLLLGWYLLWLFCLFVYCPDILRPWLTIVLRGEPLLRGGPVFLSGLCLFLGLNR